MNYFSRHKVLAATVSLIVGSAALHGCKDFLASNAAPQGSLNEETLQTKSGVEGTLIAAYRALDANGSVQSWGNAASNWVYGSVASDDAYKGSEKDDQPPIQDIEAYHWSSQEAMNYLNDRWNGMYEGVVRANSTIRLLNEIIANKPALFSCTGADASTCDDDAKSILGEALFLRAHYHFEAWRMWGSIPYYRAGDNDFRKANETPQQVSADLLVDLDSAIALFQTVADPTKPRNNDAGRAFLWTAKAYKARVLVYSAGLFSDNASWTAALTLMHDFNVGGADQAANPYRLVDSFDHVWTGFAAYANSPEQIFAYMASVRDGEPNGNNANWGERLNFPNGGASWSTCCGFHQPSHNLVNAFKTDANGLPLGLSAPATWNTEDSTFANDAAALDPRIDWTVGRDGVPYKDYGLHARAWIRAPSTSGPYSPKKNVHEHAANVEGNVGWTPTQTNAVHIHLFRYADLLLMEAEAEVEVGTLANATAIVNKIRTRASQTVQGCGISTDGQAYFADAATTTIAAYPQCAGDNRIAVPLGDPSVTWATYNIGTYPATFASQAVGRDAVRWERRVELAMEGQRFFDLRRWKIADVVLDAYMRGVGGGAEEDRRAYLVGAENWTGVTDRHYWYPIPALQVELSKVGTTPMLTQNAGW